jgi:transaldolase/glucose-6-phosphate isomerase
MDLKFAKIFNGEKSIGGRFSALSPFGVVPALAMGVDSKTYLNQAQAMTELCRRGDLSQNTAVRLGIALGVLAQKGFDKLTLIADSQWKSLPLWIEQLIAESTGKNGKGIIPVIEDNLTHFSSDRHFVYIGAKSKLPQEISNLSPLTTIFIESHLDLGQEFYRWEMATAVAGAVLGENPFDQPDVEAAKIEARKLTDNYESSGVLNLPKPFFEDADFQLFSDDKNGAALGKHKTTKDYINAQLTRLQKGDYLALLGYVQMSSETEKLLSQIKKQINRRCENAVCLGFGPRFLHSSGQLYKGGPNTGVFLQLTTDHENDLPVPGKKYSFGTVEMAQAQGDFQVLLSRQRRALRIHFKKSAQGGLRKLASLL